MSEGITFNLRSESYDWCFWIVDFILGDVGWVYYYLYYSCKRDLESKSFVGC